MKTSIAIGALALAAVAGSANASWDGQSVLIERSFWQSGFPSTPPLATFTSNVVTVGPGVEVPGDVGEAGFAIPDLFANSLILTCNPNIGGISFADFRPTGGFNGLVFTDLDGTIGDFANATITFTDIVNGTPMVSFDADHLYVSFDGTSFLPGQRVEIAFTNVPTPGAAAILGLGGLLATRRRR